MTRTYDIVDADGHILEPDGIGALLERHDLTARPEALAGHLAAVAGHRFNLADAPSLHGQLLRMGEDRHVLALVVHHGAADGSALAVLAAAADAALYEAKRSGRNQVRRLGQAGVAAQKAVIVV